MASSVPDVQDPTYKPTPDYTPPESPGASYADTTPKPESATAASYTADQREIDKDTGTVQGQITGLLDDNSKYIQRARTKADQVSNSRGLLNSSIAAGAGEAAAIDAALPIAQSDANAYNSQSQLNQNAVNQAGQYNASNEQQTGLFNADFENQGYFREQDVANKIKVDNNAVANQTQLNEQQNTAASNLQTQQDYNAAIRQNMDVASREYLQQQDIKMQEKLAAGEISQQNMQYYSDYVSQTSQQYNIQRTKIELDPGLTVDEKNAAAARLDIAFQGNMEVVADLYGIDISWSDMGNPTGGSTIQRDYLGELPADATPEQIAEAQTLQDAQDAQLAQDKADAAAKDAADKASLQTIADEKAAADAAAADAAAPTPTEREIKMDIRRTGGDYGR